MANHSPKPDNYVGKKTFAEALAGEKPKRDGPPEEQPTAKKQALKGAAPIPEPEANPARANGGSKK